jgi:hypothetical protein
MTKILDASNYVTKEEHERASKTTHLLLTGVVVVLFVGFCTLLLTAIAPIIEAWQFQGSNYQALVNTVTTQKYPRK